MNHLFRESVTSAAFHLTLTARQTEYLLLFAANVTPMHHSRTVGTFWQLVSKGLIELRVGGKVIPTSEMNVAAHNSREGERTKKLTRAGELVVALLIEAGYRVEYTPDESSILGEYAKEAVIARTAK